MQKPAQKLSRRQEQSPPGLSFVVAQAKRGPKLGLQQRGSLKSVRAGAKPFGVEDAFAFLISSIDVEKPFMRHCIYLTLCLTAMLGACSSSDGSKTAGSDAVLGPVDAQNGNNAVAPVQSPNTTAVLDPNHPASGPLVRLLGRFDTTNPNQAVFAWPASSMLTRVNGTGVTISLSDPNTSEYLSSVVHNWYDVFVDGVLKNTFQIVAGTTSYTAVSNLPEGDHVIKVSKRTEAQMGAAIFGGFTPLAGGTLLPAPQAYARRIEFIGDSITAGYGADGNVATTTGCLFTTATENADTTFASITAQSLAAEYYAIGFSGKGIVQNDDCTDDPYYTLPILYPSIIPIGDAANENNVVFTSWVPQAVVINLGTNDYNQDHNCAVPSTASFVSAWVNFIKVIRGHYPSAAIFATVGPELHSKNLDTARINIVSAVSQLKAAGDSNVFVLELPEDTGANGYGCAGHPNKLTHSAMAAVTTSAIKAQLGW